jgi:hypothetical protein
MIKSMPYTGKIARKWNQNYFNIRRFYVKRNKLGTAPVWDAYRDAGGQKKLASGKMEPAEKMGKEDFGVLRKINIRRRWEAMPRLKKRDRK